MLMPRRGRLHGSNEKFRPSRLSQARWQAVLETARDAIISIDGNARITLFNPAAEEMFGYR
jgi:PAS domain-containing protein